MPKPGALKKRTQRAAVGDMGVQLSVEEGHMQLDSGTAATPFGADIRGKPTNQC